MQYVDLDGVVSECLSIIGLSGDDETAKVFIRQWVWRECVNLPITDDHVKVTRVYPKNLILKKPDDFRRLSDIALYDSSGNLLPHVFHSGKARVYPNTEQYVFRSEVNGEEVVRYIPVDLSEDSSCFYLGTTGSCTAYADIRYYAYPLGKDGLPRVPEEAVMSCMLFARFMWSLRKNENQSEIANNRTMYQQESDRCRARLKAISGEGVKTIGSIFNRLIPNFNRSRF